ncbi:MAG: hypothetical protein PHZ09_08400, partial [Eubacteriales bacterium]|nr:hypothetical protein [Eubacteriales bacterium]
MNRLKRLAALLIPFVMLFCAACSAAAGIADVAESTVTTAAETEKGPDIPEIDFEGGDFTFLILTMSDAAYPEIYVWREEYDGEVVNDAIIDRNRTVEDRFNTVIKVIESAAPSSDAKKSIAAGDASFHAIYDQRTNLRTLAAEGFLLDLNTLRYTDYTADYWDRNAAGQYRIAGKLYFMPSDISMLNLNGAMFLYFNKKLIDDYNLEDPYELFDTNRWTLDNFVVLVGSVSTDLDGDGKITPADRWGMMTFKDPSNGNGIHFYIGSRGALTRTNDDGSLSPAIGGERTVELLGKLGGFLNDPEYCLDYDIVNASCAGLEGHPHVYAWSRSLFTADHYLFFQGGFYGALEFSDMKSDYGVMPNPKFDESQENYWHKVDVYNTLLAVPSTNGDTDKTGVLLEYMAYVSHDTLLPAFYDTTLMRKKVRDEKSIEIADTVKGS